MIGNSEQRFVKSEGFRQNHFWPKKFEIHYSEFTLQKKASLIRASGRPFHFSMEICN
jgi:hypothetical protein